MDKKGKLIVIEGSDFSGKQTQVKLLYDRLNRQGIKVKTMRFPRYETPTGRIIGQCLLGKKREGYSGDKNWFKNPSEVDPKIASLYYAADRLASAKEIRDLLNKGFNLILDRYYQSNMGHQGGKIKNSSEREKMFDWIYKLEMEFLKIPKEDFVIFLHMPYEVALELQKTRLTEKPDPIESNIEHLKNAEKAYLQLSKKYKWIKIECAPDRTLSTLKSTEEIHKEVQGVVKEFLIK